MITQGPQNTNLGGGGFHEHFFRTSIFVNGNVKPESS